MFSKEGISGFSRTKVNIRSNVRVGNLVINKNVFEQQKNVLSNIDANSKAPGPIMYV